MNEEDENLPHCNYCKDLITGKSFPVGMDKENGDIIYLCVGCALEAASERGGG